MVWHFHGFIGFNYFNIFCLSMFKKKKKCIVCENIVSDGLLIKEYDSIFCSKDCLKKYEKLLEEAKKKKLNNCC